jgi:hypothetical protein
LYCGECIGSSAAICAKACEDALGLTAIAVATLAGARPGRNGRRAHAGSLAVNVWPSRGYADVTGAERLRHAAMDRTPGFMRQVQEFLELNFMIRSISCVFFKGWGLAFNIFLAHVS